MWHEVSEEIPKKDGDYLVIIDGFGGKFAKIFGFAQKGNKVDMYCDLKDKTNIFYDYDREYGYCARDDVLYWMKIPTFPKD